MVACICSICQIVKINPFVFVPGSLVALESFEWVGWRAHGRCCGGPCADASEPSWKPCLWHAALRCSWEGGLEGGEIQLLVGWPWMHLKMHGFPSLTWPLKFESIQRCIDGKSLVPAWVTSFGICLLAGWGSRRLVTTGVPRDVGLSVREWCHQWLQLLVQYCAWCICLYTLIRDLWPSMVRSLVKAIQSFSWEAIMVNMFTTFISTQFSVEARFSSSGYFAAWTWCVCAADAKLPINFRCFFFGGVYWKKDRPQPLFKSLYKMKYPLLLCPHPL